MKSGVQSPKTYNVQVLHLMHNIGNELFTLYVFPLSLSLISLFQIFSRGYGLIWTQTLSSQYIYSLVQTV